MHIQVGNRLIVAENNDCWFKFGHKENTVCFSFQRIAHLVLFIRLDSIQALKWRLFCQYFPFQVVVFPLASLVPWFGVSILFQSFEIWIEIVGIFSDFIDQCLLFVRKISPILLKDHFEGCRPYRSFNYVEKYSNIIILSWKMVIFFLLSFVICRSSFTSFFPSLIVRYSKMNSKQSKLKHNNLNMKLIWKCLVNASIAKTEMIAGKSEMNVYLTCTVLYFRV